MLNTLHIPYRGSTVATFMLVLTLLQGSSFMLTIGMKTPAFVSMASPATTALWLAMYVVAALGLVMSSGINWATWIVRYRLPLTIIMAGTCFSALWSLDTNLTLERSVHLAGTTLVALYLGFRLPLTRMLKVSAVVLGLLMVASIVAALFFPAMGIVDYEGTTAWGGVLTSKNTLGFWSAISILLLVSISFWQVSTATRIGYLFLAAASAVCLYFSDSATSILALVTASMIMIYLYAAFSLRLGLISMLVLGGLMAGLAGVAFHFIDTAELIGRSGDLTGRGEVWKQTWALILEKPWTGYGYGTIWYPTDDSEWIQKSLTDFTWTVYHAHNGLLQIASEVGLPLMALTVFMIIQQVIEIIYCQYQRQQPGVLFVLGFMVALLLSNYSEARLLVNRDLYWIFFIALPVSMLQQVTVYQSHAGLFGLPISLRSYNSEKLKAAREDLAHRRSLKKRLLEQRQITVINETPESAEVSKNANAAQGTQQAGASTRQGITINGRFVNKSSQQSIKRKLARRQRKAG